MEHRRRQPRLQVDFELQTFDAVGPKRQRCDFFLILAPWLSEEDREIKPTCGVRVGSARRGEELSAVDPVQLIELLGCVRAEWFAVDFDDDVLHEVGKRIVDRVGDEKRFLEPLAQPVEAAQGSTVLARNSSAAR